ncbi:MAG: hypothetical protein K6E78_08730 [Treponema sp.]|nr:hypothetical protein [Treponema sp.]
MQEKRLTKIRTILSVLLLIFSIFSLAFISIESHHECSGHDCPVCFIILITQQNIKLLSLTGLVFAIVKKITQRARVNFFISKHFYLKIHSLISQKIRMND